jgi:hypothetical protein
VIDEARDIKAVERWAKAVNEYRRLEVDGLDVQTNSGSAFNWRAKPNRAGRASPDQSRPT